MTNGRFPPLRGGGCSLSLFNFANICQELTGSLWLAGHLGLSGRPGPRWVLGSLRGRGPSAGRDPGVGGARGGAAFPDPEREAGCRKRNAQVSPPHTDAGSAGPAPAFAGCEFCEVHGERLQVRACGAARGMSQWALSLRRTGLREEEAGCQGQSRRGAPSSRGGRRGRDSVQT